MNKIFKVFIATIMIFCVVSFTGCGKQENSDKLTIIATSFPSYDFARAVVKDSDNIEVKMLLKPGSEMHDYEPTPQDIKNIKNSKLFIYVGGESDEWVQNVINDLDIEKSKTIKLMDLVNLKEEELIEGMEEEKDHDEHEHEEVLYDEHVWTSLDNAITIINRLKDEIIKIDNNNKDLYEKNASSYTEEISKLDLNIKEVLNNSKRKELIFGDRFPLRYFTDQYNLTYYAAFPGCSEQTEASAKTISFLINKVKTDDIPVIFHIELSSGKIAETISKETGAKVLEFNSAHNISQKDFDSGKTYVDIMKDNIEVLKEALN